MILVVGGRCQGKRRFVSENFPGKNIADGFHEIMRDTLLNGDDAGALTENVIRTADVVISDEIGCGIVPGDAFDRRWREETGRALCAIAAAADEVYRVTAGIAVRIK